jgi:hypothetical protein
MIAKAGAVGLLVIVAAMAGCQPTTAAGPVIATTPQPGWENGPAVGLAMPRIEFTSNDGRKMWLRGNTDWVTLVAFVPTEGKECNYLLPSLVDTAGRYYDKPVRVVQIAQPQGDFPHCASCVESGHAHLLHLMALCDGAHQAYGTFGRPALGTLLVVGGNGKVISIGSVDEIEKMYPRLDELASQLERKSLSQYAQTYSE